MYVDKAIDEIHQIRLEIAEKYDFDINKLLDHIKELDKQHPERIIRNNMVPRIREE